MNQSYLRLFRFSSITRFSKAFLDFEEVVHYFLWKWHCFNDSSSWVISHIVDRSAEIQILLTFLLDEGVRSRKKHRSSMSAKNSYHWEKIVNLQFSKFQVPLLIEIWRLDFLSNKILFLDQTLRFTFVIATYQNHHSLIDRTFQLKSSKRILSLISLLDRKKL